MEITQKLPYDALTKGYILVPKQMVEQLTRHSDDSQSKLEAVLCCGATRKKLRRNLEGVAPQRK